MRCKTLPSLILAAGVSATPAFAQIPETFTNLQVLPKDTSRRDLVGIMRRVATNLGVRCNHCHVGPDDLQGMDFATDERPTKKAAREMFRMLNGINAAVKALPARDRARPEVTCATCHRGAQRPPLPLEDELIRAVREGGAAAAAARFEELRKDHLRDGLYNLEPQELARAAFQLFDEKRPDDAMAVARLNLAHDADSADTHAAIGELLFRGGDRAGARASFKTALGIDPKNPRALARLKELESPGR